MPRIRVLQSVAGADFSWAPGEVVEVDDATAEIWADGYRAELEDGTVLTPYVDPGHPDTVVEVETITTDPNPADGDQSVVETPEDGADVDTPEAGSESETPEDDGDVETPEDGAPKRRRRARTE